MESLINATGMSNAELAAMLDVSPVTISNWKREHSTPPKRKMLRLLKLARARLEYHECILTAYETCYKIERNPK